MHICIYMYVYIYIYVYTYTYMYVFTYIYMSHVCIYMYIGIRMYSRAIGLDPEFCNLEFWAQKPQIWPQKDCFGSPNQGHKPKGPNFKPLIC